MTLEDDQAALGLMTADFMTDPHGLAAAHRPTSAALYDSGMQAWSVLRHADVSAMLRDPHFKKDPALAADGPYTQALMAGTRSMLFMDDPDHRRLRGLVNQAFTRRATESNRPRIQATVDRLLDAMAATHGQRTLEIREPSQAFRSNRRVGGDEHTEVQLPRARRR